MEGVTLQELGGANLEYTLRLSITRLQEALDEKTKEVFRLNRALLRERGRVDSKKREVAAAEASLRDIARENERLKREVFSLRSGPIVNV